MKYVSVFMTVPAPVFVFGFGKRRDIFFLHSYITLHSV